MKAATLPGQEKAQGSRPSSASIWWVVTLGYYASCCLMHLQFSLWLVRQRDTIVGRMAYADLMPALALAGAGSLALWLALRLPRSPRSGLTAGFWLLWLTAVVLIDWYLTFSMNEYAHYPQYALLAWLVARAMDPQRTRWYVGRVLFWTTLLGAGDELLQYLWITTSYSDYLDFNDMVTNLVAAAAGTLLYYGTAALSHQPDQRRKPVLESAVAIALTLLVVTSLLTGRVLQTPAAKIPPGGIVQGVDGRTQLYLQRSPDFYGSWQSSQRHGRYHVLAPVPGLLLVLLVGMLFAGFGTSLGSRRQVRANMEATRVS